MENKNEQLSSITLNNAPALIENYSVIGQKIYDQLPAFYKKVCKPFPCNRERDVVLISSIIGLSACFPEVSGLYHGSRLYSNLYAMIIAPPASGKGRAINGKIITRQIDRDMDAEHKRELEVYNESVKKLKKAGDSFVFGDKPRAKRLNLPANASAAYLMKEIVENEVRGNLIFASEADTLGNVLTQDWGSDVSTLLRVAFQHEPCSSGRVTSDLLEINRPKISCLLTGTPGQLHGIVKSVEDGLFTRFIFYPYSAEAIWEDVSGKGTERDLEKYFVGLANDVRDIYQHYLNAEYNFSLTENQWIDFNQKLKRALERAIERYGAGSKGIVFRMGLIAFRLCMIFSILDHYENKREENEIVASDEHVQLSLNLAMFFLRNSLTLYSELTKTKPNQMNDNIRLFLRILLPGVEYTRKDAVERGLQFGFSIRTIDYYLKSLMEDGHLTQPKTGVYLKAR